MKLIILAAGYATRLYPLTLNQPKPLLQVAGKPMMEHLLDHLTPIRSIDQIYIVTNAKYADHFQSWANEYQSHQESAQLHDCEMTNQLMIQTS